MIGWMRLRQMVLERDGYCCQNCFEQKPLLEVHHKIPKKKGGPNVLENLMTICHKCHTILEPRHVGRKAPPRPKLKSIKLSDETYALVRKQGEPGESIDRILTRMAKWYIKNVFEPDD